jgi:hypothetical protein
MKGNVLIKLSCICVFFALFVGCMSTGVRDHEEVYLITIADLAAQGVDIGTPSQAGENYTARRYVNGTNEVEYEYDSENDPENSGIIVFYSEADFLRNESLAITAFDDAVEAYLFGAALGGNSVEVREVPDTFTLGDQNYSAVFDSDGYRVGNLVVTRKGNMVYSFILIGPYIDRKAVLQNLIGPKLALAVVQ